MNFYKWRFNRGLYEMLDEKHVFDIRFSGRKMITFACIFLIV